jgi:hypothetical protein
LDQAAQKREAGLEHAAFNLADVPLRCPGAIG